MIFDHNVVIINPRSIYLGDYVSLGADCVLTVINRHFIYKYQYQKPIIKVESNVGISKGTILCAANSIHLKKYVMIGPYCFIGDYDHAYEDVSKPIVHQSLKDIRPVVIEEGAWIGANVTVCSGVTIGKNSVVGAGSVVTKDIPSFSLAVGVPAKVIKKYNFKTEKWEQVKTK